MERSQERQGFTLIELLIVVLIIAILAAIAVPNFLEFQVRAKVSRAENDMRTYATAIEAYTVDWGRLPFGYTELDVGYPGLVIGDRWKILWRLTSPIAYMSSLPVDPFGAKINGRAEAVYYFYNTFEETATYGSDQYRKEIRAKGYHWVVYSLGPNRLEGTPWIEDMLHDGDSAAASPGVMIDNIYDPTNGSVSRGKIYRTNKGELHQID
jgi:prepilin-type N-terminal cleavage/methylation domain-containing protein